LSGSGSPTHNFLNINPIYESSPSTYTGTIRGLYYNLSENSAFPGGAQNIAFENVNGNVLLGTSSGNVGIGATAPSEKLQVTGNILIGPIGSTGSDSYSLKFRGEGNTGTDQTGDITIDAFGTAATQSYFQFRSSGGFRFTADTKEYIFQGSGDSIITNNTGGIDIRSSSNSRGITLKNIVGQTGGDLLTLVNSGINQPITVTYDGNVGINTSSPTRSLTVRNIINLIPNTTFNGGATAGTNGDLIMAQDGSGNVDLYYYGATAGVGGWRKVSFI
jgi:hypothetical protein